MSRWGRCDFSQFREFMRDFERLSDSEIDDLCVACSKELAARLLALVIPITPVGQYPKGSGKKGGTLRRGWGAKNGNAVREYAQSLPVTKFGNTYMIEVINPIEYASYVEFGHRTVSGGWVDGQYMLTIAEEKLKRITSAALEEMVLRKLREVCGGRN